ncbi:MAG: phenylacetate--CoA ligase [Thermovirga sp.]
MFHEKSIETMDREELAGIQDERLRRTIRHAWEGNLFYRTRMEEIGLTPEDIRGVEDLHLLPMMDKDDLRRQYPLGLCCVDETQIREVHMSSGSTGTPVMNVYTEGDLRQWAGCMARCYAMAGMTPGDRIQITPTFGLFNGGFGFFHGARERGLFVVPTGSGNTARQVKMILDLKVKGLGAVVSYSLRIMEFMEENGIDGLPSLKVGLFGAEGFSEGMREKIEKGLGIEAFNIYGMTETGGVGTTGMDCPDHSGIHVWEDHYIIEIVDPATGKTMPDGQEGEVVFTSLTREAVPVIRFRTRDISRVLSRGKCACGRTHVRIDRIKGRLNDMIIVKGVNFYPQQVEEALMKIPGVGSHYEIILEEAEGVTDVRINVEVEQGVTGHTVVGQLKQELGFSPKGDVYPIGSLPRMEGKQKRVFHRTLEEAKR